MVRDYTTEDRDMVEDWHQGHGSIAPPEILLPKLGIVVSIDCNPSAAMWLYMDNSTGVCFPDHIVTRPCLGPTTARKVLEEGIQFLRWTAAEMGYGAMICHTLPAIARTLKKIGFKECNSRAMVQLWIPTREDDHGN